MTREQNRRRLNALRAAEGSTRGDGRSGKWLGTCAAVQPGTYDAAARRSAQLRKAGRS